MEGKLIVGPLSRTKFPVPEALAANAVATFVPNPLRAVTGRLVSFINVAADGVPRSPPLTRKPPSVPVLIPSAVTTPVPVAVDLIPVPEPPPSHIAFEVSAVVCVTNPLVVFVCIPIAVTTPVPVVVVEIPVPDPPPTSR